MNVKRNLVALAALSTLTVVVVAIGDVVAADASTKGACSVKQAKREVAKAKARLREAKFVYRATKEATEQHGQAVGRWVKLARKVGWPKDCIPTLMLVIKHESGGDPTALNDYSGAGGLTQLLPPPKGWSDPETNLRIAYEHKYLPALKACGDGWLPWDASL